MSLGVLIRTFGGPALALAVALPFVLHGGCGSNATNPGMMGGSSGDGGPAGGAGGGGGSDEPEVPMSVCPKDPIVTLTTAGVKDSGMQPALAWGGDGFLVVWNDGRDGNIYGALVDAKGKRRPGKEADILIADTPGAAGSAEVVSLPGDDGFLVSFEECATAAACSVGTVALGADGQPKGMPTTVSPPANVQRRPYLAAGFGNIYITYRDRVPSSMAPVARVAMLDAGGAQMGEGLLLDPMSGQYPHVAVSDEATARVAVVYEREKPTDDIVLAIYDKQLAGPPVEVPIRTGMAGGATNCVVSWNTNAWTVAWEDSRSGEDQIHSAVVDGTTNQVRLDDKPAYDENGNWPTIASGANGVSLVGFYGYPGQRVFLSRINAQTGLRPGQVVLDTGKFPAVAYNPKSPNDEYAVVYEADQAKHVMFGTFTCASAM